ncbi:hypothetical protein F8514_06165 [Bacillus toyonensis]|nr:hypothetical protein F8503_07635 [Bacillus toyonensis]QEQ20253.1 hypothetical protein F0362_21745 [Bacillus sp. BS98]KAB2384461.1 hypothetical protein F8507_13710 [Bacillus toyonensis]KAB2412479.1 hypothetical protein F8514_06165 [Bacillus toyonensis]MBE7136098.1 hypothetical protein [Bacillus toyonensis]
MLSFLYFVVCFVHLSRYLWAVRTPPQNSAEAKKLGGGLPVKARLVRADNQWGMNKTPTD